MALVSSLLFDDLVPVLNCPFIGWLADNVGELTDALEQNVIRLDRCGFRLSRSFYLEYSSTLAVCIESAYPITQYLIRDFFSFRRTDWIPFLLNVCRDDDWCSGMGFM